MARTRWKLLALLAVVPLTVAAILVVKYGSAVLRRQVTTGSEATRTRPTLVVEATYAGASAQVVADTIAAPIEQQLNGIEKVEYLRSVCSNDGSYRLWIVLAADTDVEAARIQAETRLKLAEPLLPEEVRRVGVSLRAESSCPLLFVALTSPDQTRDVLFLGYFATRNLKDDLARLNGVAHVMCVGRHEYTVSIRLDADKLAACNVTLADVHAAIQPELAKRTSQPAMLSFARRDNIRIPDKAAAPLSELEQLGDMVVKADAAGRVVRVRDVGIVELGADIQSAASSNGRPAVVLAITPLPFALEGELRARVIGTLDHLRPTLPAGLDATVAVDLARDAPTPMDYLLLDVDLPFGTSPHRAADILSKSEALLRKIECVQMTLALSEHPLDRGRYPAAILVGVVHSTETAEHERHLREILFGMDAMPSARFRVRDLTGSQRMIDARFSIDLAVHGPELDGVTRLTDELVGRLSRDGQLTDIWTDLRSQPQAQVLLDVDRAKAKSLGVAVDEVIRATQTLVGRGNISDVNDAKGTLQIHVDALSSVRLEELRAFRVRNQAGALVPLATIVTMRDVSAPIVVHRINGQPMQPLTANLAPGASRAAARASCIAHFNAARSQLQLSPEYELRWLGD